MSESIDRVVGINIYPIKSCRAATIEGKAPTELEVGPTGFEFNGVPDRGWVIKDNDSLFVSQRGWNENQARSHRGDRILATVGVNIQNDHLAIKVEDHGSLKIPFDTSEVDKNTVKIFGADLVVVDQGEEAAHFFSELLGRSVRLTKADSRHPRMLPEKYHRIGASNRSAAADGRPFSLASQASLDYLHSLLGWEHDTQPLNRYRANIEIDGQAFGPFGEDKLRQIRVAIVSMYIVKALSRCPIPNIDQMTGNDDGRLSTQLLRSTRMGWSLGDDLTTTPQLFFAQSLNHIYSPDLIQTIAIGDPVTAVENGEPNFTPKKSEHKE